MAMNMEVADVSRQADVCFSTDSTEPDNVNSTINDHSLMNEPSASTDNATPGDEEFVNAQLTNEFRADVTESIEETKKREETAASSTSNDCKIELLDGNANDHHISQTPLAFTIDFGNNKEVDTARYQNLFERYNARHRRNLSTSKVLTILN